jgi:transposase
VAAARASRLAAKCWGSAFQKCNQSWLCAILGEVACGRTPEELWGILQINGFFMRTYSFLPHLRSIHVETLLVTDQHLTLVVATAWKRAPCPLCRRWSKRVHSRYERIIRDLPWAGRPVIIRLRVRRFFCGNAHCSRRIFAERVPDLVVPHGRLATPLRTALQRIGLALGGRAGARLAGLLGLPVSSRTLVRLLQALPEPAVSTPRVLGLDDFSCKRGQHFGTALVDLETRCLIDLLPERSVAVVAAWLRAHPGVEIVARDRNGSYAEGVRQGAPTALQVADRFHLVNNLVEALERLFLHHRQARERAAQALTPPTAPRVLAPWQQQAEEMSRHKLAPKITAYERVWALRAHGYDLAHIARTVGVSRPTVYRYLSMDQPPAIRRHRRRKSQLDPFVPYLRQRWGEGCRNGHQLWREIRAMGYGQSARTLGHLLTAWRRQDPQVAPHPPRRAKAEVWTARRVAFLFIARRDELAPEQTTYLTALQQAQPALTVAYHLAQAFMSMLRERRGKEQLREWIAQAQASECAELRNFAKGLRSDQAAVEAGLTLPWSTGPVEGHIHKVKLIKRSMYGKAGFPVLRQRLLRAA